MQAYAGQSQAAVLLDIKSVSKVLHFLVYASYKTNSFPFPKLVIKCLKFETQKGKNSYEPVKFF